MPWTESNPLTSYIIACIIAGLGASLIYIKEAKTFDTDMLLFSVLLSYVLVTTLMFLFHFFLKWEN